jgi:4-hydroxyphenylpyruvate dioxygenase-like putative hemolysin
MFDHMAVDVIEGESAIAAVRDCLGFEVVEELSIPHERGPARVRVTSRPTGGFQVVLGDTQADEQHPVRRQIAERGGPGVHHLAHRVIDVDDAVEKVRRNGAKVIGTIQEAPGLRQVFVRVADDGTVHELVQRTGVSGFTEQNTAALMRDGSA